MAPTKLLPYSDEFASADEYVDSILHFSTASTIFQTLCGGVHILDFFTSEPSLYHAVIPQDWRSFLLSHDSMDLLDLLMRDDPDKPRKDDVPESLLRYIRDIRKHSLQRTNRQTHGKEPRLPRHVAVGMIPKKIHEVSKFAEYVVQVADDVSSRSGHEITHFVDFGSGQNYLGRYLASSPYNKHIVAVESKQGNINGAKGMDVSAGIAEREKVRRNKKVWRQLEDSAMSEGKLGEKARRKTAIGKVESEINVEGVDLRPSRDLATIYKQEQGKGFVQYVEHVVQDGDLSKVVEHIQNTSTASAANGHANHINNTDPTSEIELTPAATDIRFMTISIHSCGNLSHHGIRSLLLNPSVHAIAIIGCCYNLMTERLGPSTYKLPVLRQNFNQRSINTLHVGKEANACDPNGFPMSERIAKYRLDGNGKESGEGIKLNITARMMAVQAPQNWTEKGSESFFIRHFYRALLQKIFLDYGVVSRLSARQQDDKNHNSNETTKEKIDNTQPIIIGSLRKGCYVSFTSYVRGALDKILSSPDTSQADTITEKMSSITDAQICAYEERYRPLKKELCVTWSLMAFSAGVVESLIVLDRWLFLRERPEVVREAWVEAIFDFGLSPRNLVVVGVKR